MLTDLVCSVWIDANQLVEGFADDLKLTFHTGSQKRIFGIVVETLALRKLLNHTFVSMLVACGMDSFLVNVRDQGLMATFLASASLIGQDEWSMEYIRAFRAGKLDIKK